MTYYNIEIAFSKRKRSLEAAHSDDICYVLAERLFYIPTRDTSPSKKYIKNHPFSSFFAIRFSQTWGWKKSNRKYFFLLDAASIFYKLTDEILVLISFRESLLEFLKTKQA